MSFGADKPQAQVESEELKRTRDLCRELAAERARHLERIARLEDRIRRSSSERIVEELLTIRESLSGLEADVRSLRWHAARSTNLLTGASGAAALEELAAAAAVFSSAAPPNGANVTAA